MIHYKSNKNIVISAVGDESLHRRWMPANGYDIFLIYYGDNKGFPDDSKFYKRKKGTKFHLVHEVIDDIKNYDYVWIPDDDIFLDPKSINEMFEIAKNYDLEICQPSIIGWYGLKITLCHHDSFLRYTNYVEIMCPCFSQNALQKCKDTFLENKSGWGIDAVWHLLLGQPTDKLAIIDEISAMHTRPIGGGDMYKNQLGVDSGSKHKLASAMQEAAEVYKKYYLKQANYKDISRGNVVSQELFANNNFSLVEFSRIYKSMEAGHDVSKRCWPPAIKDIFSKIRSQ